MSEVKNIIPPREIRRPWKADEGRREARRVILKETTEKQAAITAAEGDSPPSSRADAVKQQRILGAEGEAQAILAVRRPAPTPSAC